MSSARSYFEISQNLSLTYLIFPGTSVIATMADWSSAHYSFRFSTQRTAKNFAGIPTFLYNDGPIESLNDENLLVRQTYDVWRNDDKIANDVPVPPANIGPRSTPGYAALAGEQEVVKYFQSLGK